MANAKEMIGNESAAAGVALKAMRERGGTWAAFQNHDLGHTECGKLAFLQYGPGCTLLTPPEVMPDSVFVGVGWRYRFVGLVDLESGRIVKDL